MGSIGSFSLPVIKRLLNILNEHSSGINRTNLAGKAGLNYGACAKYVELLELLRWVDLSQVHGGLVFLTRVGREFMVLLVEGKNDAYESIEKHVSDSIRDHHDPQWNYTSSTTRENDTNQGVFGNIMIIEDDRDLLLTYKLFLTGQGLNVIAFSDPHAALQEFASMRSRSIDLVVSDIRMKSMNGIQLYKELKLIDPDIRIILVSALDAGPELVSALPGFRKKDFISKPVNQDVFTRIVKATIAEVRSQLVENHYRSN